MAVETKTIQQKLEEAYKGQYQWKQILASEKVGSAAYVNAKKQYDAIGAIIKKLETENDKQRNAKKTAKTSEQLKSLQEDYQRAQDYGTQDEIDVAKRKLDDFQIANPNKVLTPEGSFVNELRYGPNGESLVPGTEAYRNGSTIKPTGAIKAEGTTKTIGATGVTGATTTSTTTSTTTTAKTVDPKQIWIDSLTQTFKTIPDPVQKAQIDNLFKQARAGKWNEATFMEALKNTSWWKTTSPTLAQFFIESHDPRNEAGFKEKMTNYTDYITSSMEKLGIRVQDIDPVTGKLIDNTKMVQGIAGQAIANGWTDAQLAEHLATKSEVIFTGGGLVGSYMNDLKNQALKYGINLDNNQISVIQRDLLNPSDGKDSVYYMNSIKQQAIDANPWFAPQLKEGRTLYDVTSTYRQQMANLLEVAPEDITWNDLMKKVVNKDQTGINTFADFTKTVKNDPLWQYTRNAKETYSNTALDLLRQFGFTG